MEAMTVPADKSVEGRIQRLARIAMTAVLVGGLFAIAYLHANGVASCLNDQLARRNTPAAQDAQAHIGYAQAQKRYAQSFSDLLGAIATNAPVEVKKRAFRDFAAQATAVTHATSHYVDVLTADQNYRDAHKLGSC
jgi:hypothetical protein